jgi:predicted TIM-barrel fold metal-dependent hydrolase
LCLVVCAQFEQAQLPPHAQPPEVDPLDASLVPTTAKVENMGFVLVLSHSGQTWRWSRLA